MISAQIRAIPVTGCVPALTSGSRPSPASCYTGCMSVIRRVSRLKSIAISLLVLATLACLNLLYLPGLLVIALLLGMSVLGLVLWALAPIARKRGWGSEGRLTRQLNRPRFEDESRRANP